MGPTATVSPFRRLRELLAPEAGDIGVILVYGIGVGVLSLVVPIATQTLVNTAAFGTLIQPLVVLGLLVLAVLTAAGVLRAMQVLVAERIQQRVFARLAIELSYRLPRTRYDTYDTHRGTALVNRFMDVMTVQKNTTLLVLDGVAMVLQTAVGMTILALYHPYLIGFDLLLLGGLTFVVFVLGRGAVQTSVRESYAKYDVLAWLEELARAPLAFRHAGATAWARKRADQVTLSYIQSRNAHFRIMFRQIVGTLVLQAVASAILLGLGGWLVTVQQLSLGQLVAAELIVTPLVYRFARLGKYLEALYDLLAGADKIGSLFDLPLERADGTDAHDAGPAHLRLRKVSYAHDGRAPVLDALELDVSPGDRVALIGGPGSGKSALADMVTGLRAPTAGVVELDGVDLRQRSSEALRETVELVREAQLFDGTLEDNVRLGREDPRAARELLDALGLLDELSALPKGLATYVSGAHSPLHAGQALRLAVARALLGRPRLLVLDEVLDELDLPSRERVLDLVLDPRAPWTLMLTTRRLDIARRCARVLRLGEGRLAEVAT